MSQGLDSEDLDNEHEETEDEFLERYAQTTRELQEEALQDAENGQDEDGHEIELGKQVLTFSLYLQCSDSFYLFISK